MAQRLVAGVVRRVVAWRHRVLTLLDNSHLKRVLTGAVITFALLFAAIYVYRHWQELEPYRQHLQARYPLLLLAFCLYPTGLVPNAAGWHHIMRLLQGVPTFSANARVYCYSCLPRRIPGGIWHIAGRGYLNKELGVPYSRTLLGTLIEWVLLVASGLLIYLVSQIWALSIGAGLQLQNVGLAAALLVPLLILLLPACLNRVQKFLLAKSGVEEALQLRARDVLVLLMIYIVAWVMGGIVLCVVLLALSPLSWGDVPAVIGAWAGAGAVGFVATYLVQGLGVQEITLAVLLAAVVPVPVAAVSSILMRLLLTVGEIAWPLLWVRFLADSPDLTD